MWPVQGHWLMEEKPEYTVALIRLFDDPLLLIDGAVLPLGFGPRRALDWDEFCNLRGSVHLRS